MPFPCSCVLHNHISVVLLAFILLANKASSAGCNSMLADISRMDTLLVNEFKFSEKNNSEIQLYFKYQL